MNMFGRKKEKADITPGEPQFQVRYVGSVETFVGSAKGCTSNLVQKIWDKSEEERKMKRYAMLVTSTGIILREAENKKNELKFDIKSISHYSAEKGAHDRVFSWIYQDSHTRRLMCHAVLCPHREKAQQAAVVLSRSLHIAYRDWKGEKTKNERRKVSGSLAATRQKSSETTPESPEVNYNFHFPPPVLPAGGDFDACASSHTESNATSRNSSVKSSNSSQSSKRDNGLNENCDSQSPGHRSRSDEGDPIQNGVGGLSITDDCEEDTESSAENTFPISSERETHVRTTVLAYV